MGDCEIQVDFLIPLRNFACISFKFWIIVFKSTRLFLQKPDNNNVEALPTVEDILLFLCTQPAEFESHLSCCMVLTMWSVKFILLLFLRENYYEKLWL